MAAIEGAIPATNPTTTNPMIPYKVEFIKHWHGSFPSEIILNERCNNLNRWDNDDGYWEIFESRAIDMGTGYWIYYYGFYKPYKDFNGNIKTNISFSLSGRVKIQFSVIEVVSGKIGLRLLDVNDDVIMSIDGQDSEGTYTAEGDVPDGSYYLQISDELDSDDYSFEGKIDDIVINNSVNETDITPPDLKFNDLEYDPERYISEDFYLRESREAKISFFRNEFLINHFVEPSPNEIMNVILYTDEKDNIISEKDYNKDPENNNKETVIDQYSKILVKILQNGQTIFLGFVKLAEVSDTADEIELTCVDFLDLIQKFAEQLKYNIPGKDSYEYYLSKAIIQDLLDKIGGMTGLNLKYALDDELFEQYIAPTNEYSIPANVSFEIPQTQQPPYRNYETHSDVTHIVSRSEKGIIFYQLFRLVTTTSFGSTMPTITKHYNMIIRWKKYSPEEGLSHVTDNYHVTHKMQPSEYGLEDFFSQIDEWLAEWLSEKEVGTAYVDPPYYYYLSGNQITKYEQQWYSTIIPYQTGHHSYLDLLKVITLTNNITIYQKGDKIFFARRSALPNEGIVELTNEDILTPFSVDCVSHDELEFDVLEDIIYDDSSGQLAKNIEHVKTVYQDIFGETYTKELSAEIRRYRDGKEIELKLGSIIEFIRDKRTHRYLIVSILKKEFSYKIKAYRTGVSSG